MRGIFRRMMPYRKQFWYRTWDFDRSHVTSAERSLLRRKHR